MEEYKKKFTFLCDLASLGQPLKIMPLSGGGGDRKYFRIQLSEGADVIGVVADDLKDSEAFINLSIVFRRHNINVPQVLAHTSDYRYYLEEDLGNESLFDLISQGKNVEPLVSEVMSELAKMQCISQQEWSDLTAYRSVSERQIKWDLNYFKYEYLKPAGINFDEDKLEDDFQKLANLILDIPKELWGFQMRDCQSRNIMLHPEPYFIDYQGGRFGPCLYDAVSFLWQAKAGFDDEFRAKMFDLYVSEFSKLRKINKEDIIKYRNVMVLFRILQVLGAYGFRGLIQKRAHFIESIPGALKNLSQLLETGVIDSFPELKKVSLLLINDERFFEEEKGKLRVKVFSFSYKKGYPEDFSGNGGGFMFDCRGMHNPGRYDEYKNLTGRDKPVKDFLEERGEAQTFINNAYQLVSPSVDRYLKRGFSSLHIGFGCTGGRHRSVYCAENVAHLISRNFPDACVELIHREQNIKELL